jgi:hypothetical protein
MRALGFLLALTFGDAQRLADDSFEVREGASWRLSLCQDVAWPALLWATKQPDLEQRRRAEYLLSSLQRQRQDLGITLFAVWLFYGPDDLEWPDKKVRYLGRNVVFVRDLSDTTHRQLEAKARAWSLLRTNEAPDTSPWDHRHHWVNIARHRAAGLANPYSGQR